MENKKGRVIMAIVISLVSLALALAAVLIIYKRYPWYGEINRESCHQSIVQRSTFNAGPIEFGKTTIPLQCKTEKICLSMSGEDCRDFPKPTRERPVTKIKIDEDSAQIEILDAIAESKYNCQKMLGRGLLDFMPHTVRDKNYCLICARVAFDDKAKEEVDDIGYGELYRYLQQKRDKDGKRYLSFLYPGWSDWTASKTVFRRMKEQGDLGDIEFEDWKMDIDREGGFVVVAQMAPKGEIGALVAGVGAGAAILTGADPGVVIICFSCLHLL